MSFVGNQVPIPIGSKGLRTDDPDTQLDPGNLVRAVNVQLSGGRLEKIPGAERWNFTAFPAGVVSAIEYFPSDLDQRIFAVCRDGKFYRAVNRASYAEVTGTLTAPVTVNTSGFMSFLSCGEEEPGRPRKLFFMNGVNPVQVVEGDGTTRRDIQNGAADWTGTSQPFFAITHRGRVWAFGNDPHRIYASSALDHENFTAGPQFQIYPGEGQGLRTAFVFRQRLYVAKFPKGLYVLDDSDPDSANWLFNRVLASFGAAAPQSAVAAFDDVLMGNSYGSVTSIKTADVTTDLVTADLFAALRCQQYLRDEIAQSMITIRQGVYYENRQQVLYVYRSSTGLKNDRILIIDYNSGTPRILWADCFQPNCLFMQQSDVGVSKPHYGSDDGFIYEMDRLNRNVADEGYRVSFDTPFMDFGTENSKNFSGIELVYEPTGRFELHVEVFIDSFYSRTITFMVGSEQGELGIFKADNARIVAGVPHRQMQPLTGSGRRIRFRCYNEGVDENVRIIGLNLYLNVAGQEQKKG